MSLNTKRLKKQIKDDTTLINYYSALVDHYEREAKKLKENGFAHKSKGLMEKAGVHRRQITEAQNRIQDNRKLLFNS